VKNIGQFMKQAQQLQAKMAEMQEKMGNTLVEGSSGGGMVKATVSGKGELKKLKVDPSLVDANEIEILEDLIVAAVNDARSKSEAQMAEEMSKVTGGLQMPGGMKLPF
jgi:DNA-binding YbaB/EbfC family protein